MGKLQELKSKKEREEYIKSVLLSEGYNLIDSYKSNGTPLLVEILEGQYKGYKATIRWGNFTQGKRPTFKSLVEKEKFLKDTFEAEGYSVISIPENVKVTDKIKLISPEGYEWSVSYDTFRIGVRCPLDSDRSWGERCVSTILKDNGIKFKAQHTIRHPDGSRQFMDFYVKYNEVAFDIEYNGRQHYQTDPKNRIFLPVEEQKAADEKKKRYCIANNIMYVEIPYTIREVTDIAKEINKYIPVDETREYIVESSRYHEREIAEYYMTHSEKETAEEFDIAGSTVRKIAYKLGHKKEIAKHTDELRESVLDYYKTHSAKETSEKFNISKHVVTMWASKYKIKKPRSYTEREVINYYMHHTIKETQEKFGIGSTTITEIMRRNGIKKQKGGKQRWES